MVVHTPKVSRWPQRGGLDLEFPSPWTPARDRQGLALSGRYARQFGRRMLIGYSQLTYTHAHTRIYTCIHIYIYIRVHTPIHTHRPSGHPPPADAPHCICQLPAQTLKLINCKSSKKIKNLPTNPYESSYLTSCKVEHLSLNMVGPSQKTCTYEN